MLPLRRAPAPAAPLLTFPPSPPHSSSSSPLPPIDHSHHHSPSFSLLSSTSQSSSKTGDHRRSRKNRSLCYRILATVPLGFIYSLLSFSFYSVVYSLSIEYYLLSRGEKFKTISILISYGWLLFGCGGSLWMCFSKSQENFVSLPSPEGEELVGVRDEEEEIGILNNREGEEEEDEDEEDEQEEEVEGMEQRGLLNERRKRGNGGRKAQTIQVKADGTKRFCRKCRVLKPDRAHHCSTCQRCVLKMDHHCPWLGGGCAGYANYKFFVQFLLYTGALGIYISFVCFYSLINYTSNEPSGYEMAPISWALAALLGIIFGSATGLFGLYHLYLVASNRTTIEAMESPTTFSTTLPPPHLISLISSQSKSSPRHLISSSTPPTPTRQQSILKLIGRLSPKQKLRMNRAKRKYNVYDLGWKGNLKEVFTRNGDSKSRNQTRRRMGDRDGRSEDGEKEGEREEGNWWEWIVPWGKPAGDGYSFPINHENLRKLEEISREIWAEVEAEERERSNYRDRATGRYETGLTREGGFEGDESENERSDDAEEDERPLRRA
ncbi:hypothetical protein JCM3765_006682 [Sporobolomyces pararoseus]